MENDDVEKGGCTGLRDGLLLAAAPGAKFGRAGCRSERQGHHDELRQRRGGDVFRCARQSARISDKAVDAFLAAPSTSTLQAARDAWKASRVPYMQTEGYRFGNKIVDDWEGNVNSWPLDEGLIDYVDKGELRRHEG